MSRQSVVILGATSHVAQGLIERFGRGGGHELHLFARRPDTVRAFTRSIGVEAQIHEGYELSSPPRFDTLINCVGTGTSATLAGDYSKYFSVTEAYDNLAIQWLRSAAAGSRYISLSSGAVYGHGHRELVDEDSCARIEVNRIHPRDFYGIARLHAEAKHRSMPSLNIIDLRLFSYFSRYINLNDAYFLTDLLRCIKNKLRFKTHAQDLVRDYLHPDDLFQMVMLCMHGGAMNRVFDVVSRHPVGKFELIEWFTARYGLDVDIVDDLRESSATGFKGVYGSRNGAAGVLGYRPAYSSLETVQVECQAILAGGVIANQGVE